MTKPKQPKKFRRLKFVEPDGEMIAFIGGVAPAQLRAYLEQQAAKNHDARADGPGAFGRGEGDLGDGSNPDAADGP